MSSTLCDRYGGPTTVHRDPRRYVCEVDVVELPKGELLAVFAANRERRHMDHDDVLAIRSHDGGKTWDPSSLGTIFQATDDLGACNPSLQRLSDGTLIMHTLMNNFYDGRRGILADEGPQSMTASKLRDSDGLFLSRSQDAGATWSPVYRGNVLPMRYGQPADGLIELPDGTLRMACTGMNSSPWQNQSPGEQWRSFLLRSDDKGLNWEYYSTIAYDPAQVVAFHEPALARTRQGLLVSLMRSEHAPRRRHGFLWLACSRNDGYSWSAPEATDLWGYPADLVSLADGRVLATYGYRRGTGGLRGCLSEDGLRWDRGNEFVIREGGYGPPGSPVAWHIGYPATIQLADGTLVSMWHEWDSQQENAVQFVVSLRYTLDDIDSGRFRPSS